MTSASTETLLWFLNTLVKIRVSHACGPDEIALMEHVAPFGDSPPLHVHRSQDEGFIVLEGELRVLLDGREISASAGDYLLVPQGTPHTYCVLSKTGARFITVTRGAGFEDLVRFLGRPAPRDELPAPAPPTPQQIADLASACARFGIDIVGPPLSV